MIEERVRTLVRFMGATKLAEATAITERQRWQTVATNRKVKVRVEDLEELLRVFPQYELWLLKGVTDIERGQIAPEHSNNRDTAS